MPTRRERLERAIARLEKEIINPSISDIKFSFGLQIGYHAALIVLTILINIRPSLNTIIGSLGLGGLGFGANFENLRKNLDAFFEQRNKLKKIVINLKIMLRDRPSMLG